MPQQLIPLYFAVQNVVILIDLWEVAMLFLIAAIAEMAAVELLTHRQHLLLRPIAVMSPVRMCTALQIIARIPMMKMPHGMVTQHNNNNSTLKMFFRFISKIINSF